MESGPSSLVSPNLNSSYVRVCYDTIRQDESLDDTWTRILVELQIGTSIRFCHIKLTVCVNYLILILKKPVLFTLTAELCLIITTDAVLNGTAGAGQVDNSYQSDGSTL